MNYKNDCLVCGKELIYLENNENVECYVCNEVGSANARCAEGHYVCDNCHSLGANDLIEKICMRSSSQDPLELAVNLMKMAQIKMHGPEHHFLVPAVILTAYCNTIRTSDEAKGAYLKKARDRAGKVPGGFCGFYGDCGAAVGTGIMVSVLTGSTPLSKKEWRLSNLMTAKSLFTIANHGGPRCCKRNSFLAINEAVEFLKENLGTALSINKDLVCEFSALNKECLASECLFHDS
jgi:hypothetical protein